MKFRRTTAGRFALKPRDRLMLQTAYQELSDIRPEANQGQSMTGADLSNTIPYPVGR